MTRLAFLLTLALLGGVRAQTAPATGTPTPPPVTSAPVPATPLLLPALQNYPSLVQARLALEAARQAQGAAGVPVSASLSGGVTAFANVADPPAICSSTPVAALTEVCAPVPASAETLNVGVRTTVLPVGDVKARRQQAALAVAQAELGYTSTLAGLQGQAVLAAQRVRLSDSSLALARQVLTSADLAVQSAQNRVNAGGATEQDLRQAQLTLTQAQNGVLQAQENAALAHATLRDLIGTDAAPELPNIARPVGGTPASVAQAGFALTRAQVALDQATWNALPTVQGSYTHYTSDTTGVGASLDSRSLSPSVNFTYGPRTPPLNRVGDQFSVGVSVDLSAAALSAPSQARSVVDQARAGVEAARRQADLQLAGLDATLAQAQRQRDAAAQALQLAQQQQQNLITRQGLGLASPTDVAQAGVAVYQAQLALDQAQLAVTDALLRYYTFFALPVPAGV